MVTKIDFTKNDGGRFNMMEKLDKRADERFASNAAIIFSYFSTKNRDEKGLVTTNLSAGGMCFESKHSLKPGTGLHIRAGQNPTTFSGNRNCNKNLTMPRKHLKKGNGANLEKQWKH